jgi:hypothetical protein
VNPIPKRSPALAPGKMSLTNRIVGRQASTLRVLLYGVEGVGKSTWAAGAPNPIFLCAEEGTHHLDVQRFPAPSMWLEVLDAIEVLRTEEHDRKTLVIDTLDWLEPLCWAHVCKESGEKSIEGFGYGRGYTAALDAWRTLLARVDELRAVRGMHIVALAHTAIRPFKNPDHSVGDFDRYELKLHAKAAGLWKEWADCVFFAQFETYSTKTKDGKVKGISTGARVIQTERTAAWDAKNRLSLPAELPLSWQAFSDAAKAARVAEKPEATKEVST